MKKILIITAAILAVIALIFLCVYLFSDKDGGWKDYYGNDDVYEINLTKEIEDFPGTEFIWVPGVVSARYNGSSESLIYGFPVWNCFFFDLTGDGFDDLCATVSVEEEYESDRIVIYDYQNRLSYEISDEGNYNYRLMAEDDKLVALKTGASDESDVIRGSVVFEDGLMTFSEK